MEIIQITPEELRATAESLRLLLPEAVAGSVAKIQDVASKYDKLADKLDADRLDAMTFCAAKGVQA
ncbi:hypothetical protein [Alcanivorax sp.]|uniref:hypothetical protein n=1 Tax=Alcanivorax sp. TaxID=1872427 RepID=UPI000C0D0039|nr:hypothetical protein [Alcanivorax sp.]PHR67965.1 MAG: hypothetical protein COA55_03570 [Alcanivorax sp.]